ncbi:hypothetical protein EJ04DRAFT_514942 [Polyplosphaeria fusca]|uniref:PRP1 splicing factor N-terminal domain-containing protein n=1 Tax=Polyplosphaeria fusca TaxID=682080 RepID=A0A9P4UWA9_9PLEO|nr:hypothetical protein EJ04DRAFT_514942 [Polyplosphaeria fusca]
MIKRDFLSMPAPENYVAGLGRGATGFTTRSDLGPAREGPSEEVMKEALAKRAAQLGQAAPTAYGAVERKEEDDEERFQDPDNEVGLFVSGMNYDKEDDEADQIYQDIDEKMDKRRRARREAREQKERDEYERNNPKIQLQFADLKRSLSNVSEDEWAAIPEVGDMTGKAKRAREARISNLRSYAVPDSVMAAAAKQGELATSISSDAADGTMTNFASIGAAQQSALQVRLDSAAAGTETESSASGTATVDPRGYMTALDKAEAAGYNLPLEDIKRSRVLLESAVKTNVHNGPGYVALCRLEEVAGKLHTAKRVIQKGCEMAPRSIVVWDEAIRINRDNLHNAKVIAAAGIQQNPKSIKLWVSAIDLEKRKDDRKKVTRQALDHNPQSVELWKTLISDTDDLKTARMLFAKAVDTVPLSEELWLGYIRCSDFEDAQKILNAARKAIPTSSAFWIQGCRLSEEVGQPELCIKVMVRAVKNLVKESAMLSREEWLTQASVCEKEGHSATARAIVATTVDWGLEEDDTRCETWLSDAKKYLEQDCFETARAILEHARKVFTHSVTVWKDSAELEKKQQRTDALLSMLEQAVTSCPTSEPLWLMYASETWAAGKMNETRKILMNSLEALPGNESLYTRAVEIEIDANEYDKARVFLQVARRTAPTDRLLMRSVVLERQLGQLESALDLVNDGLQSWPGYWKLHALKGQLYESMSKLKEGQEAFSVGTRACPKAPVLYILLARLQERMGAVVKARSTLERGRQHNPNNPQLLLEGVRLERRVNDVPAATKLMAIALKECPLSGALWAERIMHLESRTQRKPRALEAVKTIENSPEIFVTIARVFWAERRLEKAASWFTRACNTDADYGDAWVWYYKYLEQHGTEEKRQDLLNKAVAADPHHGETWQHVRKDPKNFRKGIAEMIPLAANLLE